jgi:hypothetical protein
VPTSYYRLSGILALEAARQRLLGERHQSPTRVLGYADRLILRVDHWPGCAPDDIIHQVDPSARRLPQPPTEERLTLGPVDKPTPTARTSQPRQGAPSR